MNSVEECIVGETVDSSLYVLRGFPFIEKICEPDPETWEHLVVRVECQVVGLRQSRLML